MFCECFEQDSGKTAGARPQASQLLVAEIVQYYDVYDPVPNENQAKTLLALPLSVEDPLQSVIGLEVE